jgi:hypothetical protein
MMRSSADRETTVIAGLDPAIHPLRTALAKMMDARVKPAHDAGEGCRTPHSALILGPLRAWNTSAAMPQPRAVSVARMSAAISGFSHSRMSLRSCGLLAGDSARAGHESLALRLRQVHPGSFCGGHVGPGNLSGSRSLPEIHPMLVGNSPALDEFLDRSKGLIERNEQSERIRVSLEAIHELPQPT